MENEYKKIKVLMIGLSELRLGGMWTVASQICNNELYNSKVDLTYIPVSTNGTVFEKIRFTIHGYIQVLKYRMVNKADILHIHMAEKGSVYRKGLILKLFSKSTTKTIIHMHAGPFMSWYDSIGKINKKVVVNILNSADKILVLGEYWKKELQKIITEEDLVVIYNGVRKNRNLYNEKANNILYMGILNESKGTIDLLDAIVKINDLLPPDINIILCGSDMTVGIVELIERRNLAERVKYAGWLDRKEIDQLFENTMFTVLPSYFEGLSMSVIESAAAGIPVIATDISAMKEILGDCNSDIKPGDIDTLAEKILAWSLDKKMRAKNSKYLYKRTKELFTEEIFINKLIDLYIDIL